MKRPLCEMELIGRVKKKIRGDSSVVRGIGDDAAVIKWNKDIYILFASDMMIEGVHFDLKCSSFGIGWKALGINISDIAAMGGTPRYAVISLGLPKRLDLKIVDGIYSGLNAAAGRFSVNIVGGDTNSSNKVIIDVAIIGAAKKGELVFRSGAKAGDIIMVTGTLGGSIKGRHLTFMPRLKESRFLVKNFKINSMIDISDGLSSDLRRICEESRVGAKIYESLIPVSKDARSVKNALNDGEDFELLFTVSKNNSKGLMKRFKRHFNTPVSAVGEIINKNKTVKIVDRYGKISPLEEGGFRHF